MRRSALAALLLIASAGAQEDASVLTVARRELYEFLSPPAPIPITMRQRDAQNEAARESANVLALFDVPVRVVSKHGVPYKGIELRALHLRLDLSSGPVVTDERGEALLRLPKGIWRVDFATHEAGPGKLVFGRATLAVAKAGPREITLNRTRFVRFRSPLGEARAAHQVTLAWPDLTHHKRVEAVSGQLEVVTAGDAPLLVQAVRRPTEQDPNGGYLLRRALGAGTSVVDVDPKDGFTEHTFEGREGRVLSVRYGNADPLPLDVSFTANGKRTLRLWGLERVVLALDVERGGRRYGFYPRPVVLDGKPVVFRGIPPFAIRVGYVHNWRGQYKHRLNSISIRVLVSTPTGLLLQWRQRSPYQVSWQQVLDGQVRAEGVNIPPQTFETPPVDPKRIGDLRYRLHLRGPGENRKLELAGEPQQTVVQVGKVRAWTFPELAENARMWIACVNDGVRAYEDICPRSKHVVDIERSMSMPPGLAGMGGYAGGKGWMWLPENRIYGFVGLTYVSGLLYHELGHVFHYGHGNPVQSRIMRQAGRRALRRYQSIRPGVSRIPEGDRYRPLLEAVTRGEIEFDTEFEEDAGRIIPILKGVGAEEPPGDGVLVPNIEITGDDALFTWFYRSMYGAKADAPRRKHAPSWSWWLTCRGYTDPEIQVAMLSYAAGASLGWLARMRGTEVHDHRLAAAVTALKEADGKFVWQKERNAIKHRWATRRYTADEDLEERKREMRAELGERWARVSALIAIAREYLVRRDFERGEAGLLEALVEARLGGEPMLERGVNEAALIWAAR